MLIYYLNRIINFDRYESDLIKHFKYDPDNFDSNDKFDSLHEFFEEYISEHVARRPLSQVDIPDYSLICNDEWSRKDVGDITFCFGFEVDEECEWVNAIYKGYVTG